MKKIIALGIAFSLLFVSMGVGQQVQAKEVSDKKSTVAKTINDLQLTPGKVNKEEIPKEIREKLDNRISQIDKYFEELADTMVKIDILNKKKNLDTLSVEEDSQLNDLETRFNYLDNNSYEIVGIQKIDSNDVESDFGIASTEFDASVAKPTVYWDSDSQMYVINGSWSWNKTYPDDNVGGPDGFGLRVVQEPISLIEWNTRTYDQNGNRFSPEISDDPSAYGIGMRFQDTMVLSSDYSAYSGNGWLYFKFYNGVPHGKTVNFGAAYAHSYNTTHLTGLTAGVSSFGFNWDYGSDSWKRESVSYMSF